MTTRLLSIFAALAAAGCGTVLGNLPAKPGWERAQSRPQETDATMSCSGKPCETATLFRSTRGQLSVAGFTIGTAIDLSMVATGVYAVNRSGNAGSGALLTTGILFALLDGIGFWTAHGGAGEHTPWALSEPTAARWHGERIPVDASDLLLNGQPRLTFSVASMRARLEPESADRLLCLRAPPIPRTGTTLVLFDAVPLTNRIRVETLRYLSEVVRARAAQVAPGVHVLSREEIGAKLGGFEISDGCSVTCRLEIASELNATVSATAEVSSEGQTLSYVLAARSVKTGEVLWTARAYGKTLDELDSAVRNSADSLFGCRD
jgi:hypothetical protein